MKIKCNICGKSVSTKVPDNTVIRAWVECPECIEKGVRENSYEYAERIINGWPKWKRDLVKRTIKGNSDNEN